MGFFNAFGYKFYAKKGTSSSTAPTASTGLTEIKNLSNAGISSSSDSQEVITYDTSTNGWKQQIITANSYTISCELNIDTKDSGYKLLKEASRDCATGVMIEWFRETPGAVATTGPAATLGVTSNGGSGITATGAALTGVAVTSTSGSGTGLTVNLTVAGGVVTAAAINAGGTGYKSGDSVTIAKAGVAGAANDIVLQVLTIGATGTAETHAGIAAVGNFSEDIQAGNVAKCSFDLVGYGPYVLTEAS